MGDHVDIIKNEWLAGFQHVVARVYLGDGAITVSAQDETWDSIVRRPVTDRDTGRELTPDSDPARFFWALQDHIRSDYLFATEPHDEDHCPWHAVVVPIGRPSDSHAPAGVR